MNGAQLAHYDVPGRRTSQTDSGARTKHTWVVLQFTPLDGTASTRDRSASEGSGTSRTRVRLVHLGFNEMRAAHPDHRGEWDEVEAYFRRAWPRVLARLRDQLAASAAAPIPEKHIFRYDPVELVNGREMEGKTDLTADHYIYRYCFASAENRQEFLHNPARYEIQLGGACGRMGPLSGLGDPQRFAVHAGQIYIFASDACRTGFRAAPDKLLDKDDPEPAADAAAQRRGRELIEKAVAAVGGHDKLDQVFNYQSRLAKTVAYEGKDVETVDEVMITFPDAVHRKHTWGQKTWSTVMTGDRGWFVGPDGDRRPMHDQQRRALRRQDLYHNLVWLLKASRAPGFAAIALGPAEMTRDGQGQSVESVAVWIDGTSTTLGVDPQTGEIRHAEFRARGPRMSFGNVRHVYGDYRDCGPVRLPGPPQVYFDGELRLSKAENEPQVRVNVEGIQRRLTAGLH